MIRLGDKAKPITAEDLIRRYNLDGLSKDRKAVSVLNDGLTKTNANLENYIQAVTKDIEELQNQVDGNVTTWFFTGVPTLDNPPANEWITEEDKINHLGDLYYDQDTGYAYRWIQNETSYTWLEIKDTDVAEALALANSAKDTADSKRRIFVPREIDGVLIEQPTTPYDVGDIWIYRGEIYRCIRSRESGDWNTADWVNDLIYTDDTTANKALTDLENFTQEVRNEYVTNKVLEETENSISSTIESVQIQVDKKSTTFREQPTTPYKEGDVWIQNEKIYVCVNARESGNFTSSDWELNLDNTKFATKTQLEQTDRSISAVAESVNELGEETRASLEVKVDAEDLISKINASAEEINLKSDRFSLDSTYLDIENNGKMKLTSEGIYDNTSFVIKNSDNSLETRFGAGAIGMGTPDQVYTIEELMLEDGRYTKLIAGANYDKKILIDNSMYSKGYTINEYVDENGYNINIDNGNLILNDGVIINNTNHKYAANKIIPVQYYSYNSGMVDVATSVNQSLGSGLTLPAGRYIVVTQFSFSANSTGMRRVNISTTSGSGDANIQHGASPSGVTRMRHAQFLNHTKDTTIYWNVCQTSGATLSCNATAWIYRIQ